MVYARELADRTLTLLVSGKLWRNSMIMQDEETGTLWSHVTGEALEGELTGGRLEIVPGVHTTWAEWRAAHPGTLVLEKSEEIKASRYENYFTDPERTGLFRANWLQDRMPGKTVVYGLRSGPHAVAVTAEALAAERPADDPLYIDLGGEVIAVQMSADGGVQAWRADGSVVDVLDVYWFAWSTFYPNTSVVD